MTRQEFNIVKAKAMKEVENGIEDGPVTEAYWEVRPRLLWVLKEANSPDEGSWSLCDFLANKDGSLDKYPDWKKTYWKVAQVSFGLLNHQPQFDQLPNDAALQAALQQVAVVNVSKTSGGGSASTWPGLEAAYKQFGALLHEQIDALEPEIVIAGNVLGLMKGPLELDKPTREINGLHIYEESARLYLDAYHPAYWSKGRKSYYSEIMDACQSRLEDLDLK